MLKKPVFLKGSANWIDELPSVSENYNNTIHHSTNMMPSEASKKINEVIVYFILSDKRKERQPKYKLNDFVRTANKRNMFSNFDTTNWNNKLLQSLK